ncbi:DUF6266 family protein [Algoriphagus halophytocola]|uniref:DUF6266 family protein n=1 Tax=Algoriphagus halophytocola TaxID=2991499 RepID=UPI0022DD7C91|nr:DUF6266 family protein [Algoriphagus sp. TR-M9]WBL43566.1 DUF6266 family protein [Algoriphagus sp. TR-M9]
MGKVTDGLLGGISGKVGNLVFYQVNGETLVRSNSGNRSGTTALQSYNQQAFALVQEFLSPMKRELAIGFASFKKGTKRGIDRAKSLMLKNGIYPQDGIPLLQPMKALVSSGDLTGVKDGVLGVFEDSSFSIEWTPNSWDGSARDSDQTFVVVYDTGKQRVFSKQGACYRKDGFQEIELPWSNIDRSSGLYVYFSFYSERGSKVEFSDSVCLGKIE